MKNLIHRIDETLLSLLLGILLYGLVCQLVGMWFVPHRLMYTLGLWIGVSLALFAAWHMWWTLDRNLTANADNEKGATAYSTRMSLLRYAIILLVFWGVCATKFCYPLAAFLGIMGLKVGAYLSPAISNRLIKK